MKEIRCTKGMIALVDDEDFELVSQFKWQAIFKGKTYYAFTGRPGIRMHRMILGLTDPRIGVDHKNHNGLDNRRENLRISTQQDNVRNQRARKGTSKYKGVFFEKSTGKYKAAISVNYKTINLGRFFNELDAARAYDEAAKKYFGNFAVLNFQEGGDANVSVH